MHTCLKSNELGFWKHPRIVEKKIEICKQEVQMPPSLLFLDEDLGSLHFLFVQISHFSQLCYKIFSPFICCVEYSYFSQFYIDGHKPMVSTDVGENTILYTLKVFKLLKWASYILFFSKSINFFMVISPFAFTNQFLMKKIVYIANKLHLLKISALWNHLRIGKIDCRICTG
jgi:hypothetical protein